jgi:hypothetical protein
LVGALFASHPPGTAPARVFTAPDGVTHPVTASLPSQFGIQDEWYNFMAVPPASSTTVLLQVDEETYLGGTHGAFHPITWARNVRGGRSVYTAMGHREETFKNECFFALCSAAIDWLLDRPHMNGTCLSSATTNTSTPAMPCCTTGMLPLQNERVRSTVALAVGVPLGILVCIAFIVVAVVLRRQAKEQREREDQVKRGGQA